MTDTSTVATMTRAQNLAPTSPAPFLRSLGDWLGLAAAPCFAGMAVVTAIQTGETLPFCSGTAGAGAFGGMVPMYGLMAIFHLKPWIMLMAKHSPPEA